MPVYPEKALRSASAASWCCECWSPRDGVPLEVKVERGARADLTAAAIAAASQWRFEPARKGGRAVRTYTTSPLPVRRRPVRAHAVSAGSP